MQDGPATLAASLIREDRSYNDPEFDNLTALSARRITMAHLLDGELSPSFIAKELKMSLRNLRHSFARTNGSVMDEIRRPGLQGAHNDLISAANSTVSAVAQSGNFLTLVILFGDLNQITGTLQQLMYVEEMKRWQWNHRRR
ncbi:hypothetical protein AB0454_41935 [Streptomyces sp. NPDC093509]|uniref:hypothetical protein n=1 Tax=Streptomyces sp. NPDC093509 TaxID=3154982 RepID=UPI00344D6588